MCPRSWRTPSRYILRELVPFPLQWTLYYIPKVVVKGKTTISARPSLCARHADNGISFLFVLDQVPGSVYFTGETYHKRKFNAGVVTRGESLWLFAADRPH